MTESTTRETPRHVVAVVGAATAGAEIAHILAKRGAQVGLALRVVQIVEGTHLAAVAGAGADLVGDAGRELGVAGIDVATRGERRSDARGQEVGIDRGVLGDGERRLLMITPKDPRENRPQSFNPFRSSAPKGR